MKPIIESLIRLVNHTKKVPLVIQYEMVECGAASLSMLLRYYGLYLPLVELREACGVSRDGSNLLNIKMAALNYGMKVKPKRISAKELMIPGTCRFPCIGWWNYNHFVVFQGIKDKKLDIVDPSGGRYSLKKEDVLKSFSGLTMYIEPDKDFKPAGQPEHELLGFLPYIFRYKDAIIYSSAITVALLIPSLVEPGLSGSFVNDFILNKKYSLGLPILWLSILFALLSSSLILVQKNIIRRMSLQVQRRLSLHIARKLFTVEYNFYVSRFIGDIASRLNLATSITTTLVHQLLPFIYGLVGAILILPFIMLISWQLSILSLLYVLINSTMAVFVSKSVLDENRSMQVELGKVNGITVRMLSDTKTIRASGLERSYLINWQQLFAPMIYKTQSIQARMNTYNWASNLVSSLYDYGTIAFSGLLVMQGEMNLAGFMAFQVLRSQVTTPLLGLANLSTQVQQAEAELGRLGDLYSINDDNKVRSLDNLSMLENYQHSSHRYKRQEQLTSTTEYSKFISYDLKIKNLTLTFSPIKPPALQEINLEVPEGSMLSIIGPSGSGKSTLIKVLAGLYEPTIGEVLYGDHIWNEYQDLEIHNTIGYVSQDICAIRGTISQNITFFNELYELEDIRRSAKLAMFDDIPMNLPRGYSTLLGDGGQGLSGGQLQRLEITRSLLSNPKILLLDEATSALDIPTEKQILNNLREEHITTICVAHRLISAKMSDQVLILDDGKIVELGNPSKLQSDRNSYYSKLLASEEAKIPNQNYQS